MGFYDSEIVQKEAKQLFEERQRNLPEPEAPSIKLPTKEEKELFRLG